MGRTQHPNARGAKVLSAAPAFEGVRPRSLAARRTSNVKARDLRRRYWPNTAIGHRRVQFGDLTQTDSAARRSSRAPSSWELYFEVIDGPVTLRSFSLVAPHGICDLMAELLVGSEVAAALRRRDT